MDTYFIILFTLCCGIAMRSQWEGGFNPNKPTKLAGEWGFTGFRFITRVILTLPGVLPLINKNFDCIISWVLHCASFYIWYILWRSLDWDPSGHICATLIALILLKR